MALRDRVVLWVLAAGAASALPAWRFLGPWVGLVLIVVALLVAAAAYRIEPPRIGLDGTPGRLEDERAEVGAQEPTAVDRPTRPEGQ